MPSINRIRVNNVKYNFGTQQYDDFTMRMYGRNTLYDLANGGGKSVLMLLLLQNMIPNCTLDDKQPIEKLFRAGCGNTTIHSLIEWKLDAPEQHEGYRYMTTGFCARKAKDSPDEEEGGREIAAIEYFNYCIFYRDYNANDIVNLPLVKDGERTTFTGWKNYLKELGRRDLKLEVHVFERKGEYQRFISQYGLYESHWEIIRGINKTEGHVRTYFESNYKTARKVVEDLLIEEIIEKAYLVKINQNDSADNMAHTLVEIKDKLVELAKKKREIADYDRQTELLHVLEARVSAFLELYEKQEKQRANIADVCVTGATIAQNSEQKMKELEQQREEQQKQVDTLQRKQEALKIKKDALRLEELNQEIERLVKQIEQEEASVAACQQELNRKESVNEYLEYCRDKEQKEEHEAMITASMQKNGNQLEELQALSREKKRRDDLAVQELRQTLQEVSQAQDEAQQKKDTAENLEREAAIAAAVAAHDCEQIEQQYQKDMEEMQELRKQLVVESFQAPEVVLEEQEAVYAKRQEALQNLEEELTGLQNAYYAEQQHTEQLQQQVEAGEQAYAKLQEQGQQYRQQADTFRKMLDIYGGGTENKSTEWMTNQDITGLIQNIHERYLTNVALISARKEQLEQSKKRMKQLQEGRLIAPTAAAEKVKYYIESRHGMDAVFGMEYLAVQPIEVRQQLLASHPLLPYGLLVENFEALDMDSKLRSLNLGDEFLPIYNMSMLKACSTEGENDCVMYLQRGKQAFLAEEKLEQEKQRQQEELDELAAEVQRLEEMSNTYLEDSNFVAGLQGIAILDVEQQTLDSKEQLRILQEQLEESRKEAARLQQKLQEVRQEIKEQQAWICSFLEQRGILRAVITCSTRLTKEEEQLRAAKAEQERVQTLQEQYRQELHQWSVKLTDSTRHRISLQEELDSRLTLWNQYYKEYYTEEKTGAFGFDTLSEEELDTRFKAVKAVFEKDTVVLEDKKRLIATLQAAMDKSLRTIRKRGSRIEELEQLKKEHRLYPAEEHDLEALSTELSRLALVVDTMKAHLEGRRQKANRLEGSIEQAERTLAERFGTYEEIDISKEELERVMQEGEQKLAHLKQLSQTSEREYQQYNREYTVMLDLYKDVKRIVETNNIRLQDAKVLLTGKEQLREVFEASLLTYDKSTKALERAKNELQRYKAQTSQALTEMQAYELSHTISNDVVVPDNYGEAKQLRDSLDAMIHVIALEKERVEQGITDMQFIKANFEKQCVQRCQDVKNELEKLPKLSRILLDGEPIQMVGLTIPYVKEEYISQRMSDYIDDIVEKSDQLKNPNERMKYIRTRLELKRLFSVIVTDMNNIKLTLYKRERMKEQSRYLRYEEAVGSTGQSQGIYIQFLVSIINYISGIYAPNGENEKLTKTIFIDNPFGAAKDVYIWEPIFALLKLNHVQLIVPARGATPAITARFDVNYILGQQMVGKRQQTVVVDYRSQVEQEELEYRNLEYEQVSFDFI